MAMATVMAAERTSRVDARGLLLGISMGCIAFPAVAGEWKIHPMLAVNETATDNVGLSSTQKKSDLVTDVNPGIRIEGSGGRSKLFFDYQLHNIFYAQNSASEKTQNALNALGTLEALENWLFIDVSGAISQQSTSPFSGATSGAVNTSTSNNTTETSTYRVSPYIRGTLGSFADYQVRYNLTTNSTKSTQAFDYDTNELLATLKGVTTLTNFGWSVDVSKQNTKFENGRSNDAERVRGVLSYQFDPQVRVHVIGGRESNDYLSATKESTTIKGAGFEWSPTERTQILASREDRFFGKSNSFSFTHRTALTAWKISESKDASVLVSQRPTGSLGNFYDLAYSICSGTPEDRAACALESLHGLSPTAQLQGGFLTTRVTLQHRREISFMLLGARNTVTFAGTQVESKNLSQTSGTGSFVGNDVFALQDVRQRGASVFWSHHLSPVSFLVAGFSRLNTIGTGTSTLETNQKTINVNLLTQLGPKTVAGVGVRRVDVSGTTNYSENALTGVLSHQF